MRKTTGGHEPATGAVGVARIGDILRVTPLVRVCAQLVYEVDVRLRPTTPMSPGPRREPDFAAVACARPWRGGTRRRARVRCERYYFRPHVLESALRQHVHAARVCASAGNCCATAICRVAGSRRSDAPAAPPFATHRLPRRVCAGTVLHPSATIGVKQWHGSRLAARLPRVIVSDQRAIGRPTAPITGGRCSGRHMCSISRASSICPTPPRCSHARPRSSPTIRG